MKDIIETLYPMYRCLLGAGYDNALSWIGHLVNLDIIEIPSGTKIGTWTVPDEWIVRDAWVKDPSGNKIIDFKKDPLSLTLSSPPIHRKMPREELVLHIHTNEDVPDAVPFTFSFYDKNWGFNVRARDFLVRNDEVLAGVKLENGKDFVPKYKSKLESGDYEVFIDSEYKPGTMKIGVHTIKGKSDREILLFAHLDHPFQANDNLSAVACLLNIADKIKCEHTVKIIFCPETIGSIGYALTQDISKVDFVIAVDICGNDNDIAMQKSWADSRINDAMYLALRRSGQGFRLCKFKNLTGSDEYVFNDPNIGIPGVLLTRYPYKEYHTSDDTPETINYKKIEETGQAILKAIDIYEKDFIPRKDFKGPLMRSKYGCQGATHQLNLVWDYIIYSIDGKKSLLELCVQYTADFDTVYEVMIKLEKDGQISRVNAGEGKVTKTTRKKHKTIQG